ncbi:exported hypothetical protein [Nitrosopumilaceae archaeon]|nr:serpin family protein [Nitrosopumilus sp.]CAI9831065.1 exported hypothetical protein [Nitrosopumilaceae archaeon]MDA7942355.1 serpin family protein [Nitrosopumilus sp.]MDA7944185.1 serpin family protein [Nitrosopumilus sp.]MDA7944732.1 serpin family protein [Nitrosopumilus sp.]
MRALILSVLSAALLCIMAAEADYAEGVFPSYARSGSGELLSDARCPGGLLPLESPRGDLVCLRKESAEKLLLRGFEPVSRDALVDLRRPYPRITDPELGIVTEWGPPPARPGQRITDPVLDMAAESNRFGVELYKVLARDGGNVFFSPIAVYLAFSALYEGARGETREQIRDVFGMGLDVEDRRAAAADLLLMLERRNPYAEMNVRSAMLIDDRFEVDGGYADVARMYGTHVGTAAAGSRDLERRMDRWAGHATGGAITDIVDYGKTAGAASVVASPVYFDAEWQGWFPRDGSTQYWFGDTREGGGHKIEYMGELCSCFVTRGEVPHSGIKVSWLQYRDSGLSMLVAAGTPVSENGSYVRPDLGALEESLTAGGILGWSSKVGLARDLNLVLAKFRSNYSADLRDPLRELGLVDVFDAGASDLAGIGGGVHVGSMVQKGAMETGWEGGVHPWKAHINHRENDFRGLPPLFFAILHDSTGTILFMGRVSDHDTSFAPVFLR